MVGSNIYKANHWVSNLKLKGCHPFHRQWDLQKDHVHLRTHNCIESKRARERDFLALILSKHHSFSSWPRLGILKTASIYTPLVEAHCRRTVFMAFYRGQNLENWFIQHSVGRPPSFTKQAITSCVTVTSVIQFEVGENAWGYKHTHRALHVSTFFNITGNFSKGLNMFP